MGFKVGSGNGVIVDSEVGDTAALHIFLLIIVMIIVNVIIIKE